jgi:hypothetical protein
VPEQKTSHQRHEEIRLAAQAIAEIARKRGSRSFWKNLILPRKNVRSRPLTGAGREACGIGFIPRSGKRFARPVCVQALR